MRTSCPYTYDLCGIIIRSMRCLQVELSEKMYFRKMFVCFDTLLKDTRMVGNGSTTSSATLGKNDFRFLKKFIEFFEFLFTCIDGAPR